jgi:3-methyladenine DNA glycosylase AlkD
LRQEIDPEKAAFLPKFFQAYPGGYGEGDRFLGVIVPRQRAAARAFRQMPLAEVDRTLNSPWHEMRLTGLFILAGQYAKANDEPLRRELVQFYLDRLDRVNNWDLVDSSAPHILGAHLVERRSERKIFGELGRSRDLWRQRIAIVANMPLVKAGEFDELLPLCRAMLDHPHDLIHKATGWLLREMGKVSPAALRGFLGQHVPTMPRTMLRYAIEKLPESERKQWLAK